MKPRLYSKYHDEVKPALKKDRNYANMHQVPCIEKIIVHMGLDATLEKSALEDAMNDMKTITGRKPVVNLARKSVSNFKLREGMPIGCHASVTSAASTRNPSTGRGITRWASPSNPFSRKSSWTK